MTVDSVLAELLPFYRDYCGLPDVGPDTPLFEAGLDSILAAGVLDFVEARLGVVVPPSEATQAAVATPRRVAELVVRVRG